MNRWAWVLLSAVYLCVLVVTVPASVLSRILDHASDGRVALANTKGTLWNGSANPVIHRRGGGLITLTTLHWDVAVPALFTGKLSAQLQWDDESQTVPMEVIASIGQVEARHVYVPLSAILLDDVSEFLKPAALRGQVILRSEALLINKQSVQGAATADWMNASSLLSSIAPLGNYHFTFSSSPAGLDITLSTTSGALLLAGQGRFSPATGLDFRGTAQAASGKEEALRELLGHMGPQERPGVSTLTLVPGRGH
jgi:general secretion pathway protein N